MIIGFLLASVSALMPSTWALLVGVLDSYSDIQLITFDSISLFFAQELVSLVLISCYILLFCLTALFGYRWESDSEGRIKVKEDELERKTHKLVENSAFMIEALETLPPKHYLANFQETYITVRQLSVIIQDYYGGEYHEKSSSLEKSIEKVEELVGFMLLHFAKLTKDWDMKENALDNSVEYRVNIMKYCNSEDAVRMFNDSEYKWEDSQRFYMSPYAEGITSDIDGVLFADKVLCAYRRGEGKDGDQGIEKPTKPIALPVTLKNSGYYDQNLPGAPKAFSSGKAQYIECCKSELHHEINEVEHISSYMKAELKSYYGEGNFAQSIISFPLIDRTEEQYGVINVYRDKSDLAKRNPQDFMALMRPIVETISEGVSELYLLRAERAKLSDGNEAKLITEAKRITVEDEGVM